jgi:hypothetical protein
MAEAYSFISTTNHKQLTQQINSGCSMIISSWVN